VAFVDHDDVEGLDGDARVVDHGQRLGDQGRGFGFEQRRIFVVLRILLLALEHGVEPLDGGDADFGGGVDGVAGQTLDRELLGEGVVGVGTGVALELVQGLLAQGVAVHQEEDAPCLGEGDQPVAERAGGVGLAGAGGHLDEGARPAGGQRGPQVVDGLDLDPPQSRLVQHGQMAQAVAKLGFSLFRQPDQLLGTVEAKDAAAAGRRVEAIGELGLGAGSLVGKGQGQDIVRDLFGDAEGVLGGLDLDARERVALGLGLDDADRLAGNVKQVVGEAGSQGKQRTATPRPAERFIRA
jgi:hypothetical protein